MSKRFAWAVAGLILAATMLSVFLNSENSAANLQSEPTFDVEYKSISSILRAPLTAIYAVNDTVIAGDTQNSVSIWTFDEKKNKLVFQDISREVFPILQTPNKILKIEAMQEGIVVLTTDGDLETFVTNAQSKITGKVEFGSTEFFTDFALVRDDQNNKTYVSVLTK